MSFAKRPLTPEEANALFDVVVAVCGANESLRNQWLHYAADAEAYRSGLEFRFIGDLGFGGKLLYDGYRPAHVTYYAESREPARDAMVTQANERLGAVAHPYLHRA